MIDKIKYSLVFDKRSKVDSALIFKGNLETDLNYFYKGRCFYVYLAWPGKLFKVVGFRMILNG